MSTEKIKAALDRFGMESRNSQTDQMAADALNELAALRLAVQWVICETAATDAENEHVEVLKAIAKEEAP